MSSTTVDIPTVISGVSQQDDSIASASQTRAQKNFRGTPVDLLHTRAPLEPVSTASASGVLMDAFTTSDGEDHLFVCDNGITVINPNTGGSRTVAGLTSYASTANSRANMALTKFGNSVFVVRKDITPAYTLTTGTVDNRPLLHCTTPVERTVYTVRHDSQDLAVTAINYDDGVSLAAGFLGLNNGAYGATIDSEGSTGSTWQILDGSTVLAEYEVASSDETAETIAYNLINILNQRTYADGASRVYGRIGDWEASGSTLVSLFKGTLGTNGNQFTLARSGGSPSGLSVTTTGGTLGTTATSTGKQPSKPLIQIGDRLLFPEGSTVTAQDGDTGALDLVLGSVRTIDDLPLKAQDGKFVRIDLDGVDLPLYYKFEADTSEPISTGRWKSTTSTGGVYQLTASTMPHYFTYDTATKAWTFSTIPWAEGTVHQKVPKFLQNGDSIEAITSWRGRLCLFGPTVFAGRAQEDVFNIWRRSTETVYPDDPIDVVPTAGIGIIRAVAQIGGDLLLQGQAGWARILGSEPFSPTDLYISGVQAGTPIAGTYPQETSTVVPFLAYGSSGTDLSILAPDQSVTVVNQHCPSFIQEAPTWFTTSRAGSISVVLDDSTRIVVQEFTGEQSELYELELPEACTMATWVGNHLWLLVGTQIGYVRFADGLKDVDPSGTSYRWLTRLDHRVLLRASGTASKGIKSSRAPTYTWNDISVVRAYNSTSETTIWTFSGAIPWKASDTLRLASITTGANPQVLSWDGTTLEASGDLTGDSYWVGIPIFRSWTPTIPILKTRFTNMPMRSGYTGIDKLEVHAEAYAYDVTVSYTTRGESYTHDYQALALVYGSDVFDEGRLVDEDFRVAVRTSRDNCTLEISSSCTIPEAFKGLTWHMKHNDKRRRRR